MTARVHLFFFSAGKAAIGGGYIRRGVTHKDLRQLGSVSIPKRTSKTVDFTIPAGTAGRLRGVLCRFRICQTAGSGWC